MGIKKVYSYYMKENKQGNIMNNKQDKIIQIEKLIERNNSFGADFLSRNEIVLEIEKIINNKEEK